MSEENPKQEFSPNPVMERFVFVGTAGLLLGLVVGALVFRDANDPPETEAPETADLASNTAELAPTRDTQPAAAGSPGEAGAPSAAAVPEKGSAPVDPLTLEPDKREDAPVVLEPVEDLSGALREAVEADEWWKKSRVKLHEVLGSGALLGADGLTPAGQAVVKRLDVLEAHALDGAKYDREGLKSLLAAATDGPGQAAAEAAVGKALLRLVLDYRFIRTAGPFKLRSEEALETKRERRTKVLGVAVKVGQAKTEAEALAHLDPPHTSYAPLLAALERYRGYAARGECNQAKLQEHWKLKPGAKGAPVKALQQRMACEGYYGGAIDGEYHNDLLMAVQTYQANHELDDDGLVFKSSIRSMNVPMARRVEQIELALQRLRESEVRKLNPEFYLAVNLPAFELRAVKNGRVVKRQKVIVGTNRLDDNKQQLIQGHLNRTKLFTSQLYRAIINPDWILPERVSKGELVGSMEKDPEYLEKHNIKKTTLSNGRQVYVQGFGASNVLGKVKFLLKKSNAIYLHDTDKRDMFKHTRRDFSHGCMRVHEAVDFGKWLLAEDGWDSEEIRRGFKLQKTQRGMDMHRPVDFMTEYVTVDVSEAGLPMFLTDIYKYDKAYTEKKLPPMWKVRWGDVRLRPHWVPNVKKSVVDQWRRDGKSAPRNYDPKKHGG